MRLRTLAATLPLLVLLACGGKLTLENYDRIQVGMPYDEVVALIGKPAGCDDVLGIRQCRWGDARRSASVSFVAGKVLLFASSNLD